jgi:predicted MFS family arabinose efflux permease
MSLVRLVHRTGIRDLLVGQSVSALGDWMGTVALMALALRLTDSPVAVGGILTLRLLPAAIAGPLAAEAAVRWDRRRTMLAMDLVRAGMVLAIPFVSALWWLYLWGFLLEVASIVFLPARDSSIPDLVDEDQLELANGLVLGASYASIPLGAALFAVVTTLAGQADGGTFALVFVIDAATFLLSFACIARLTELGPSPVAHDDDSHLRSRDAFRIPLVAAILPVAIAVSLGLGALFSLGIVFVRDVLHASDAEFGVLIALFGVGAVVGLVVLRSLPAGSMLARTRAAVLAMGVVIAVFSLVPALWAALLGAVAFGAAAACSIVAGMSTIQIALDGRRRVLAFTAFHVALRVGLGVAAVAAGIAGDLLADVRWPLVGTLQPARLVLLCSGILVFSAAALVRVRGDGT